ncbi:uncharacterized protein LOC125234117 [Leguminivora glycinivorella]|uniref:uncharacterized protein LOC125234117 n=1 Tax=Leguminivora glycinivorella TaxID=1035111 RepID=UPI00200DA6EE|nr:uncharacterized protein LOC125234117 [Leguminivora glycinivorella]
MSNLSAMSLADLVAGRGYVKAKISRTCNSVKITDSNEMLLNQKTRLLEAFKEYEDYNINILKLESNDTEPIEEYENKYLNALTIIDEEINRRNAHSPSTRPEQVVKLHQPIKLPPIDIPCFSDAYTARAYHMERDAGTDPTMEGFLDYLERRALALENAEPGTSGQPRYLPANKTVLIATEKTLQCDLCIDTNGSSIPAIESPAGDWQRTGEECSSIAV